MPLNKIKKNSDYALVFKHGKYLNLESFTIQYYNKTSTNLHKSTRFGIIASRKVGNSIKRNLAKRRIRALIVSLQSLFQNGYDYILIAKKKVIDMKFDCLSLELSNGLKKIKLIEK